VDGRVYNLILRNGAGTVLSYQRRAPAGGIQSRPMQSAYYRIHQNRALTGSTAPAGCARTDAKEQIGCLIEASPCSVGLSVLTAVNDPATGLASPNRKGLGLRSLVNTGAGVAIFPTEADVRISTADSCFGTEAFDGGFEDRYPLSRRLWLCTVDGIGPPWETTGTRAIASNLTLSARLLEAGSCCSILPTAVGS
jgi:hypothetical protein